MYKLCVSLDVARACAKRQTAKGAIIAAKTGDHNGRFGSVWETPDGFVYGLGADTLYENFGKPGWHWDSEWESGEEVGTRVNNQGRLY